jgi:hypothetical protein
MDHPTQWYKPLRWTNTVADPLVVDSGDLSGHEEWDFTRGDLVNDWNNSAWFASSNYLNDGDPDDVLQNHLGLLIFSARLRRALDGANIGGIQYLPVEVRLFDRQDIAGFAIANILPMIRAIDYSKTDFDVFPEDYFLPERRGLVRSIRKPVLIQSAIADHDVFRLADWKVMYFVSDRFKRVFETGRFTGYTFGEPVALS